MTKVVSCGDKHTSLQNSRKRLSVVALQITTIITLLLQECGFKFIKNNAKSTNNQSIKHHILDTNAVKPLSK